MRLFLFACGLALTLTSIAVVLATEPDEYAWRYAIFSSCVGIAIVLAILIERAYEKLLARLS